MEFQGALKCTGAEQKPQVNIDFVVLILSDYLTVFHKFLLFLIFTYYLHTRCFTLLSILPAFCYSL